MSDFTKETEPSLWFSSNSDSTQQISKNLYLRDAQREQLPTVIISTVSII